MIRILLRVSLRPGLRYRLYRSLSSPKDKPERQGEPLDFRGLRGKAGSNSRFNFKLLL